MSLVVDSIIVYPMALKLPRHVNVVSEGDLMSSSGHRHQMPGGGGVNRRHLLLTVLEAGKVMIKVLSELVAGEKPLSWLALIHCSLCPQMAKKARGSIPGSLIRTIILSRLPTLTNSPNQHHLPGSPWSLVHCKAGHQHMKHYRVAFSVGIWHFMFIQSFCTCF